MPALDGVFLSVCKQQPFAGDDIVEQIVVAGIGTIGVQRLCLLPAILV